MKSKILAIVSLGLAVVVVLLLMAFRQNGPTDDNSPATTATAACQDVAPIGSSWHHTPEEGVKPANLLFFEVERSAGAILLLWDAVDELELVGFQIEKSISNGPFHRVGWVYCRELSGNSGYDFTDTNSNPEAPSYYRLKMVDFDGRTVFSPVVVAPEITY